MRLVPSGEPNVRIFPLDLTVFARNAPSVCSAAIVALLRLQIDLRQSVCRQRDGGCAAGIADGVIAGRRASARHEEGARSDARPSRPRPESGRRDVGCADVNPSHRERAELLNGCSVAPFEDGQVSHADHRPKMLRGALPHVHDEVRGHVVVGGIAADADEPSQIAARGVSVPSLRERPVPEVSDDEHVG